MEKVIQDTVNLFCGVRSGYLWDKVFINVTVIYHVRPGLYASTLRRGRRAF